MKYHIKNKISRKEIRKQGLKPIPLMEVSDDFRRSGTNTGGDNQDTDDSQDVSLFKNGDL